MPELPVVCTLGPDARNARRERLLSQLLQQASGRDPLPDGVRLRFAASGETLALLARTIEAERHCCRFLRFTITVEPGGGPFTLDLAGPPGTAEFIAALLDL